jgi:hypothetical protein
MRAIFYIFTLIFCGNSFCYSQTAVDSVKISKECTCSEDEFAGFITYENLPEFPGGEQARMKYLMLNTKWPEGTIVSHPTGSVYVKFCIEKDGSISGVKIERGIGGWADEEAIRVTKAMPNWKPATQRGEPICMPFIMPIRFTLWAGEPTQKSLDEQHKNTSRRRNRNKN